MKDNATPILNAQNNKQNMRDIESFVGLMRIAIGPVLHADIDNLPENQSKLITAAAIFSGMTVGHMLGNGSLSIDGGDRDQAKLVAMQAFDTGIDQGLLEVRKAMLRAGMSA